MSKNIFKAMNALHLKPMENIENPTQEWWFLRWVEEAIAAGYIEKYTQEEDMPTFTLFEGLFREWHERKTVYKGTEREKTRTLTHSHVLLKPCTYTPDGFIVWTEKANRVLFASVNDPIVIQKQFYFKANLIKGKYVTVLDVKAPTGTNRHSDTPFSFTRKWMWQRHGLFVNKVMLAPPPQGKKKTSAVPKGYLFNETWTPNRYFMSDKLTKKRKLHYTADGTWGFEHKLKNPTEK